METIKTKRPISAEVASTVLSGLYYNCLDILYYDPEGNKRYKALKEYVDDLLVTDNDAEIVDMYLVIEQVKK